MLAVMQTISSESGVTPRQYSKHQRRCRQATCYQSRPLIKHQAAQVKCQHDGSYSGQCRRETSRHFTYAKDMKHRDHAPINQNRLISAELTVKRRNDPIAAFEHFLAADRVLGLVFVPQMSQSKS